MGIAGDCTPFSSTPRGHVLPWDTTSVRFVNAEGEVVPGTREVDACGLAAWHHPVDVLAVQRELAGRRANTVEDLIGVRPHDLIRTQLEHFRWRLRDETSARGLGHRRLSSRGRVVDCLPSVNRGQRVPERRGGERSPP